MPLRRPPSALPLLEDCIRNGRGVLEAWTRLHQMIAAYPAAGEQKGNLELQFLQTKSELARNISTLKGRMGGECRFDREAIAFIAGSTNLNAIFSQSEVAVKKQLGEWHRVFVALNEQLGEMDELRRRAFAGEKVYFAGQLVYVPRPFPWKQVLRWGGPAAALLLLLGGWWVARNMLGIGAPKAGEGINIDASLPDETQIKLLMDHVVRAFSRNDLDSLMAVVAEDATDSEGRSKTQLRAMLQTYMSAIGTGGARIDFEDAEIKIENGVGTIRPVRVILPQLQEDLLVRGKKVDGKWLVTYLATD